MAEFDAGAFAPEELALLADRIANDFEWFAENLVRIRDKDSNLVPMRLNKPQKLILREIRKQERAGLPVRLISVKSRQMGFTTLCQARQFHEAVFLGKSCALGAQRESEGMAIFGKFEVMWDELKKMLPQPFLPSERQRREGRILKLELDRGPDLTPLRSELKMESAEVRHMLRGGTYQNLQLTELPYWPDAETTMGGILPTVGSRKGTTVIIESTAGPAGDYFYNQWVAALDGKSPFRPIFLPWFLMEEYARERREGDPKLNGDEREYQARYKLSDAQMLWRRDTIQALPKGEDQFRQEFPADWQEAFRTSGRKVISQNVLDRMRAEVVEPKKKGEFVVRKVKQGKQAVFEERRDGELWIWEQAVPGRAYVVAADPASGSSVDNSAAHVLDVTGDRAAQVASFRGKRVPDAFARLLVRLALHYNQALIAPERNTFGEHVLWVLLNDLSYKRVYKHRDLTRSEWNESAKFGYPTTRMTKMPMIQRLAQACREGDLIVRCERTVGELETFVYLDDMDEKAGAQRGMNDDLVMSLGIGVAVAETAPAIPVNARRKRRRHMPGVSLKTGY